MHCIELSGSGGMIALVKRTRVMVLTMVAALPLVTLTPLAHSQGAYPSKPVRIVVPLSAGSATDILARMLGPKLF